MSETRLREGVQEFASFLAGLARRLDPAAGWYGVFTRRDPEGMRACLEGRDVPPWDVVESLLHDLAELPGEQAASTANARARRLHAQAVGAHDARPGGRSVLEERLEIMERERRHTALRARELQGAAWAAAGAPEADWLADELAWAQDDHRRAGARVGELRARLEALREATEEPKRGRVKRRPRPRGARFAGLDVPEDGPAEETAAGAAEYGGGPSVGPGPRGARFAGVYEQEPGAGREAIGGDGDRPAASRATAEARRAATATVARLAHLRATANGGLAHAELCAAANRPAIELPLLIEELEQSGLASDVPTLLWEAACLPPAGLAAAADALAAAGRSEDSARLLRQGVTRPVEEVAHTALALLDRDRAAQALELLAALVRTRTPQETAAAAAVAPGTLRPLLLDAASHVSPHRQQDVAHALRAAHL